MLGDLDKTQIQNILTSQVVGRLACVDGEQPYVVPVTYSYDGQYIYGQSNEGMKLNILRKNPNVCFEVERMTSLNDWQCVLAFGKFEELRGKKAEEARKILFDRVFSLMTSSTIHPYEHEVTARPDDSSRVKYVMYRVGIKKLSGRFESP
jgi:nitroimidazol reductase NimA-like FMN-containing flavoprotein (pyridoxamine 5'-phosphate oxidase superfamily)